MTVSNHKHGHSRKGKQTTEYIIWVKMRWRCNCTTSAKYDRYGARGIRVCERWNSFENFYADMGPRPLGTTLDRIDNNGNYDPANCRWASAKQQQRNRSTNSVHTYRGVTASLAELCETYGVCYAKVRGRLRSGVPLDTAMMVVAAMVQKNAEQTTPKQEPQP